MVKSKDTRTLVEKQAEFSRLFGEFLVWINTLPGYAVTMGDGYRDEITQARLVKEKKSRTSKSFHNMRLAHDLNLFFYGEYQRNMEVYFLLGLKWKVMHSLNVWGGDWGWDGGHFQHTGEIERKAVRAKDR